MKSVKTTLTEWKLLLKRVKIIPKWVKITPIEWISLFGEAHRGTALLFRAVPLWASPKSEIHSIGVIFTLFGVIFTHFGMIFTHYESDFHSVRVFLTLTLFTLLKSNHFTLFTLREYAFILHKTLGCSTTGLVRADDNWNKHCNIHITF